MILIALISVDLKDLATYQQLFLYFIPIITNSGFINILVVVVRLWWFRKHLKKLGQSFHCPLNFPVLLLTCQTSPSTVGCTAQSLAAP